MENNYKMQTEQSQQKVVLTVRVGKDLEQKIAIAAELDGLSKNGWARMVLNKAIRESV